MNIHHNARLTPLGRAAMISRIEVEGWSVAKAAEAVGISRRTAGKWLDRHRRGGEAAGWRLRGAGRFEALHERHWRGRKLRLLHRGGLRGAGLELLFLGF